MAGYICKIVMEDTHPPVWRRVMIPDKITFRELHEIIQVLFGWSDRHLHEFEVPSDRIIIGSEETWGSYHDEQETLIDSFFRNYKWIRYTYDFGDGWRHKIIIEEKDAAFKDRTAVLLKFKGDNFEEDSGGMWEAEEDARYAFDSGVVEGQLRRLNFPKHEELQETVLLKESMDQLKNLIKKMTKMDPAVLQSRLADVADEIHGDSVLKKRIDKWKWFEETSWDSVRLVKSVRTLKEILMDMGDKEAADYYKYLQIPRQNFMFHDEEVHAIADTLQEHPEYFLYIFTEKEYQELLEWMKMPPQTKVLPRPVQKNTLLKALAVGLADFVYGETFGEISFAADATQILGAIEGKTKKQTYRDLAQFEKRSGKIIRIYGMIELESLYHIFKNLYGISEEKEDFYRYVYWYARYNNFVNTTYHLDGTCYVSAKELDVVRTFEEMQKYAKELPYAELSKEEVEYRGTDLSHRSIWVNSLFSSLQYRLNMEPEQAEDWLIWIVVATMGGSSLNEIMNAIQQENDTNFNLEAATELWTDISGLMLDLELASLKGRSRTQYAEEQQCSAWDVGMVSEVDSAFVQNNCHMYQFPVEIQKWMHETQEGNEKSAKKLLAYQQQNHVVSEEYLYLLANVCITFGWTENVEKLLVKLKKSSPAGQKAAKHLEERLRERYEVFDEEDDFPEYTGWNWMEQETVQQPYIRSVPKIGRNDPCPCGSGKKYKKCCGKNS